MGSGTPAGVTVLAELGRGRQTIVYRVRRDGRAWAMKVFPAVAGDGAAELTALRREAAVLAWLGDPVLPQVQEVGVADRRPYLIMELIEGGSLAEALRVRPLPVAQTVRLGVRLAGALAKLHAAGLVHRDVKPQNIMLEPDGTARLIDLGMADRATAAPSHAVAGTLCYCPPEQAGTLDRPVDQRSDLYALGVVLFECLTGRPPFASNDVGDLLRSHATVVPPDVREVRADVPAPLARAVARLLAKDPDDRYQSGTELVADLGGPGPAESGAARPDPVPWFGRDRELGELTERVRLARGGSGGFAVVTGGRGTGKSRMLREVADQVRQDGIPVLSGTCPEAPLPLAPLNEALAHRLEQTSSRAVADRLLDAAREAGGAVLCLDDVHRADEATLAVLRQLTAGIDQAPLLVVLAATEARSPQGDEEVSGLPPVVSRQADPVVRLGPLDTAGAAGLVAALAGGHGVDRGVTDRIAARAGSTPFEIQEYVNAVIDAGALVPYWGRWQLDVDGLDRIALSGELSDLVLRRVDGLDRRGRDLLAAAGVIGCAFSVGLAATAAGVDPPDAERLLADAVACRAVQRQDTGYVFVHERLRSSLVESADPQLVRDAHQRVAEHLDEARADPYAVARHYLNGHADRDSVRVMRACRAAGALALAGNAPGQATALLEPAYRIAMDRTMAPATVSAVGELLGTAYHRVGRLTDAVRTLTAALPGADGAVAKARILLEMSRIHQDTWDTQAGLTAMHEALAEIGRTLPGGRVRLMASTLARFFLGVAVERTGLGFGTATGETGLRYRLEAQLYRCGGTVASLGLDPLLAVALLLRSLYPVARIGVCEDYVRVRADVAGVLDLMGLQRLGGGYDRPARAAAILGETSVIAYVASIRATSRYIAGRGHARDIVADTTDPQRRLDAGAFVTVLGGTLWLLLLTGLTRDAQTLYREGCNRLAAEDLPEHSLALAGAAVAAAIGELQQADATLAGIDTDLAAFRHPSPRVSMLLARAQVAVERRELGAGFDQVAADLAELHLNPRTLLVPLRSVYVYLAYGRLEQCRAATPDRRDKTLAAARDAVAQLRLAAASTLLKAHVRVASAHLQLVAGRPDHALAALDAARPLLGDADAPLASFEAARLRARALLAVGQDTEAISAAAGALALSVRHGWPHRTRWIRDEFSDAGLPTGVPWSSGAGDASSATDQQRLDAVTTLSLAAGRITDPEELNRVVLDETIRLLSAERAYLFLADDKGVLTPHLGRDAAGADLTEWIGYGASLVERARHSREPLVVTSTGEAAVLGSESIVTHGLRSVLVSPLVHDDRLLGVLYLDSRVADGIFTATDVGILSAVTTHIAAALETARAAELATRVRDLGDRVDQMQRLDSLGQLAGGIAHDFNNILGIISGFAELLDFELPDDSPERRLTGQISSAVDKGTALTQQLLAFGRGHPGNAVVHDLSEVLSELDPMLRRTLGEHITLHIPPPMPAADACLARVDRGRLEQVIVNLAANARDAMPGGGDLRIHHDHVQLDPAELGGRQHPDPDQEWFVRLAVSDTGTGMDAEAVAHAFEPFFTTKPPGQGTGLGLASVYAIVRNAGGLVRLQSEAGQGTTVNIYLPAHRQPVQADAATSPVLHTPPAGLRVLVVDDCAELADVTGELLRAGGHDVTIAHAPIEAVDQLSGERAVDLLISDVVMPVMTGPDLAAAVRERLPALPVIYLSGYLPAALDQRVRLDANAILIEKPVTAASLSDAIGRLLGSIGPPA